MSRGDVHKPLHAQDTQAQSIRTSARYSFSSRNPDDRKTLELRQACPAGAFRIQVQIPQFFAVLPGFKLRYRNSGRSMFSLCGEWQ